ncbi:hypothetical protein BJX66DRAFT_293854 [Aspergillus keveii]|uniref:Uncharacterized protein n=1 Tax=Aspergillus keveii TaxID=714993 RepID=A0ABR4GJC9_9EURO
MFSTSKLNLPYDQSPDLSPSHHYPQLLRYPFLSSFSTFFISHLSFDHVQPTFLPSLLSYSRLLAPRDIGRDSEIYICFQLLSSMSND